MSSTLRSDGFIYDYMDPPLFWEMIMINLVVIRQSFYYGNSFSLSPQVFVCSLQPRHSLYHVCCPLFLSSLVEMIDFFPVSPLWQLSASTLRVQVAV